MLESEFSKIGLNEKEREVYLATLKAGKITHERVARVTGINRTTVYSIAKKLQLFGLITEDLGAKVVYLVAEEPEAIKRFIQREERSFLERKRAAENLIQELPKFALRQNYSIPKIKFIEEEDLNEYLYKKTAGWAENGKLYDNTWWGFHDHSFTESYKGWIEWAWKHFSDAKIRIFTNKSIIEEQLSKKYSERGIRLLPEAEFDSSLWVIGDYILMIQSRERPHYLVEIYDPVFARNQRQLFKSLWH